MHTQLESPTSHSSLTRMLARQVIEQSSLDLPPAIRAHARMHLLNVLALTVSASSQPAVDAVVRVGGLVGGTGVCPLPGRNELLDVLHAASAIGVAAHVDDFDDTHLATVIHPSAAILATVLPLGLMTAASGAEVVRAFVWGCETQLRVGVAMSPSHYDAGWHITGTAGVIGSAAAAGMLLGLDEPTLTAAIGIAGSSAVGHRQAFGTMTKALHAGKAASNGVLAALLARDGFTGPDDVLKAGRGYFDVMAAHVEPDVVLRDIGQQWHFADDAVKPYPCGIVAHPLIDAGLALREGGVDATRVQRLEVRCNPLVPELMGNLDPADGLQARFSAVHGIAVALLDGRVGLPSYEASRVRSPDAVALRALVDLVPTPSCARDAATVDAELSGGSRVSVEISHARGSLARPLSGQEVNAKAEALLRPVLGERWSDVVRAVDELELAPDLRQVVMATTAQGSVR
jgi:2-methylcitrate dehydratase PrpD